MNKVDSPGFTTCDSMRASWPNAFLARQVTTICSGSVLTNFSGALSASCTRLSVSSRVTVNAHVYGSDEAILCSFVTEQSDASIASSFATKSENATKVLQL